MMRDIQPWTPPEIARLRAMHADGLGQCEIARRLGRTTNSVVSKCRTLGLLGRRARAAAALTPAHAMEIGRRESPKTTLPPLPSLRDA
jgi:hypothetical protein